MSSPPMPPIRAVYFVAGEPGGGGICATVSLADAPPVGAWKCRSRARADVGESSGAPPNKIDPE